MVASTLTSPPLLGYLQYSRKLLQRLPSRKDQAKGREEWGSGSEAMNCSSEEGNSSEEGDDYDDDDESASSGDEEGDDDGDTTEGVKKAAAAMAVGVGNLSDPENCQVRWAGTAREG